MDELSTVFHTEFKNLYNDYIEVKRAIILAENLENDRKILIAPLNQLRSAIDHAFKAAIAGSTEDMEHDLKEIGEHVRRAGYDAFEFLGIFLGNKINSNMEIYSLPTIKQVFPEYFTTIIPCLSKNKRSLANTRTERTDRDQPFSDYINDIAELIELFDEVELRIPSLDEYERKAKNESIRLKILKFAGLIIMMVLTAICTVLVNNAFESKKTNESPNASTNQQEQVIVSEE